MSNDAQPVSSDGWVAASIDRVEGTSAVVVVQGTMEILVVPRTLLPRRSREGHWLQLELQHGAVVRARADTTATAAARQRIARKLALLRQGSHLKESAEERSPEES